MECSNTPASLTSVDNSKNSELFELVTLKSGVKSLRQIENKEIFHPGIGPEEEARILHIEQQNFHMRCSNVINQEFSQKFIIWDIGLGAAANAITAIKTLLNSPGTGKVQIEIHSFDQTTEPLKFALRHSQELGYLNGFESIIQKLIYHSQVSIKSVDQGINQGNNQEIKWFLHLGDFRKKMLNPHLPSPHSIFYDPYSPKKNGEMWTLQHFTNLHQRLNPSIPFLMSNYSRSTVTRVTWLMAGFFVGIGATIGQKEETTVASNHFSLLAKPLSIQWLNRVKISHSSAPMREANHQLSPITLSDFEKLSQHPQFQIKEV